MLISRNLTYTDNINLQYSLIIIYAIQGIYGYNLTSLFYLVVMSYVGGNSDSVIDKIYSGFHQVI